jgi:hypothetical protein
MVVISDPIIATLLALPAMYGRVFRIHTSSCAPDV